MGRDVYNHVTAPFTCWRGYSSAEIEAEEMANVTLEQISERLEKLQQQLMNAVHMKKNCHHLGERHPNRQGLFYDTD